MQAERETEIAAISGRGTGPLDVSERLAPDFDALAERYDELRPAGSTWREVFDVIWEEGDLRGRRVLDVGCGTGRHAAALAERGARVWGVDASEEMLARARASAGRSVGFKRGQAESLPFKDGWFERAVLHLVVHLVDRGRALPELARVLRSGGRLLVATFRPEHFEDLWLSRIFPSIERIDRVRFPDPAQLERELHAAGFAQVRSRSLDQHRSVSREAALERLRGRYISTLRLLDDDEYRAGLERAERELAPETGYALRWAILTAERP